MGKIKVLGDFAELERQLKDGVITQEEYQKIFERTRFHGFDGSIHPFAVGGSDAAIIMGVSPWKTPLLLYHEKFGLVKERLNEDKEMMFLSGHLFEGPFRDLFAKKTGLKTTPCTLQVSNSDYPHLVANIDGLVWEDGQMGIYEGKMTSPFSQTKEHVAQNTPPIYYWMQVQFYMEIWNLPFAYLNVGWGLNWKNEMKHLRIPRDRQLGREICLACEKFVTDAMKGIKPTNMNVENLSVLARDCEILFGKPDKSLPPVEIPSTYRASFQQLDRLSKEMELVKAQLTPYQEDIDKLKKDMKPLERQMKELEKEETEILSLFTSVIGNSTKGVYQDGKDVYTLTYSPAEGYSLDAEVKAYWKSQYPECYEDVTKYKPKKERKLSYEKSETN